LTGHTMRRSGFPKHAILGKMKGKLEVTGIRGRRCKQLLDAPKQKRGYWKLKEGTLDRTLWRTSFGRGRGTVVRRSVERTYKNKPDYYSR
jgi:hypothetical protein